MNVEKATRMTTSVYRNFGAASAQVKQILNDPKKLQEEMAMVHRNLAALQKAEQSMRNPHKRQQVPGERKKFRRLLNGELRMVSSVRTSKVWSEQVARPDRGLAMLHLSKISKSDSAPR